jgi:periplasmic copper chaperone A
MTHLYRGARRRAPVLLVAVVALMVVAPAASAHVSVSSPDATPGGFGKLVFRVPTESSTASTVKLTVTLPTATPFAEVSAKSLPGWSIATTEKHLAKPIRSDEGFNLTKAVSTVTWTAGTGQGVAPGQFEEFELSVGPFPKGAAPMTLPTVQTYSDGTIVRWIEPTPASGDEPEHPAPTLKLASSASPVSDSVKPISDPALAANGGHTDGLARWLGGAGLVLGAVALVIAILSTRRRTP